MQATLLLKFAAVFCAGHSGAQPYMHRMNHIGEDIIHRSTTPTRVRLPGLRAAKLSKGSLSTIPPSTTRLPLNIRTNAITIRRIFHCRNGLVFRRLRSNAPTAAVSPHRLRCTRLALSHISYIFIEPRCRIHRHSDVAERFYQLWGVGASELGGGQLRRRTEPGAPRRSPAGLVASMARR